MSPWFETLAAILIAMLGVGVGGVSRRLRAPYWILGYGVSLSLVGVLALGRCDRAAHFIWPLSWIVAGRMRFVAVALAVTMGLSTPLSRLPRRWERAGVCLLMTAVLLRFSFMPCVMPALVAGQLSDLHTTVDSNGVCLQTTTYTCGPAAAVTALRRLGLPAAEGEIAVLAHSSPWGGTFPACLSQALRDRYAARGLLSSYRRFNTVSELKQPGVTLAVVKDTFRCDHCVAVLEISDEAVTLADPAFGVTSMSHEQFESIWRFAGIVLTRSPLGS